MLRAPCVGGAHTSPHCWGSSPRELQRPGEQVGGDVQPDPGAQPCPSLISSYCPCLAWPPPGSIGANLLSALSPSKHRPVPHPFNKQPWCQAVCSSRAPAQGETEAERRAWEPLGSDPPTPQTPGPAAPQLGDLAQVAALLGSLLVSIPQGEVTLNRHLVAPSQVFNKPGQGKCSDSTCLGMNSADATANRRSSAGKVLLCSVG